MALQSYGTLKEPAGFSEELLTKALRGTSCQKNAETVIEAAEAFGVSASTISQHIIAATAKQLREFKDRKAGIRDFHFHDLRHTFASHLVMLGQDITTVKELLGHKTLAMTLRYTHLAPSHKVKAMDILDAAINGKTISTKLAQSEPLRMRGRTCKPLKKEEPGIGFEPTTC